MINRYMRLDPLHAPFASGLLGHAHYMLKEYAQAISLLCDCVSRSPKTRGGRLTLIATYAQMGKVEEARAAVAELMRIEPDYTIGATSRAMVTFKNPDDDQHFFEGLRKAGLAE